MTNELLSGSAPLSDAHFLRGPLRESAGLVPP